MKQVRYSILLVTINLLPMVKLVLGKIKEHSNRYQYELIVVDNGSTDGTAEWLHELSDERVTVLNKVRVNQGHARALEQARRHATGQYIVTIDSDAFPLHDAWLYWMEEEMEKYSHKLIGIRSEVDDFVHPSCLMIRKSVLDDNKLNFRKTRIGGRNYDVAENLTRKVRAKDWTTCYLEKYNKGRPIVPGGKYLVGTTHGLYGTELVYHHRYGSRFPKAPREEGVTREDIIRTVNETVEHYSKGMTVG